VNAQAPTIDMSQPVLTGAARRGDRPPRGGGGKGGGKPSITLEALDTDKDGVISTAEMQNAAAVLLKFDRNSDGNVTQEEIRRALRGGKGAKSGKRPK